MPTYASSQRRSLSGGLMKTIIVCVALALSTSAHGEENIHNHRVALLTRLTCPAVREAVKIYGEAVAEQWARSHGVSESRIEQARHCLK
jgi:hypothetical protein